MTLTTSLVLMNMLKIFLRRETTNWLCCQNHLHLWIFEEENFIESIFQ